MITNENGKTMMDYEGFNAHDMNVENDSMVQEEVTILQSKGTPWKELSIGGTFGLLLAGGGIYASGLGKGEDEDALLAGAQASDSVRVGNGNGENQVQSANDDPVMLDEDGNPIIPVSRQQAQERIDEVVNEVANSAAAAHGHTAYHTHVPRQQHDDAGQIAADTNSPHITINVYQNGHETAEDNMAFDPGVHQVNITTVDDSLSFAEAWNMAREQLGPGQAFVWRDGVYGTFSKYEWDALNSAEQHEFTAVAVREYQQIEASELYAHNHQDVHFIEGEHVFTDNVITVTADDYAGNNDEVSMIDDNGDDAVQIIESAGQEIESLPEIITLDNTLDGIEQIESLLENDGDGVLTTDDILGTVATLINDNDNLAQGMEMVDGLFSNYESNDAEADMPDYVSDADTLGLV